MTPSQFLSNLRPCKDGYAFAMRFKTMAEVWDACERPDWLLWILDKKGLPAERERRLFACWCAEQALALIPSPDPRSVEAVRVSREYAEGRATREELSAARTAAADAAARSAADAAARSAA